MSSCTALIVRSEPCEVCFKPITSEDVKVPMCAHKYHQACLDILKAYSPECPTCKLDGIYNLLYSLRTNDRDLNELMNVFTNTFNDFKKEKDPQQRMLIVMKLTVTVLKRTLIMGMSGKINLNTSQLLALSLAHSSIGMASFITSELTRARAPIFVQPGQNKYNLSN